MASDVTERPKYRKYFRSKLTRRIEPMGGAGVELVTLEDATRLMAYGRDT
jgi:hypothetical protein